MGQDKALVPFAGHPLVEHMADIAEAVPALRGVEVGIVGPKALRAQRRRVVEDFFPGQGPLAGIHAALCASGAARTLVLAVDMPLVTSEFLKFLMAAAQASDAVVTVPRLADGWQPLCAVYAAEFLPCAERALREGRNRIDSLYSEVQVQELSEEDLRENCFSSNLFRNLNTPEEWQDAQVEFAARTAVPVSQPL